MPPLNMPPTYKDYERGRVLVAFNSTWESQQTVPSVAEPEPSLLVEPAPRGVRIHSKSPSLTEASRINDEREPENRGNTRNRRDAGVVRGDAHGLRPLRAGLRGLVGGVHGFI
jgi:hypothetical protein